MSEYHLTGREMTPEEKVRLATVPLGELMPWLFYTDPNGLGPDLLVGRKLAYMLPPGREATVNEQLRLVYVETPGDRRVVEEALLKPVAIRDGGACFVEGIERPNMRPSTRLRTRSPMVVLYAPPAFGWPWFVVVCLPLNVPDMGWGRQCYGVDAFASEATALNHLRDMASLQRQAGIRIALTTPHG